MPYNGSGTYTRPTGQPVVAGTDILDTTFNSYTADVATALSNCMTRDGQSPATANIPMGGFKLTGLAAGNTSGDALRFEQVATGFLDISASVSASALTLGLNPCKLDFRSSTLTTGTPVNRIIALALSLIVPSTATLGTIAAQSARLALLAIDNAGTVELAVTNLAGGLNLDETTLISTTAISAAATADNIIYSTTARTSIPFRFVGFIDVNEATAGTWATTPIKVQGGGGQALSAMSAIGYGQTWQNVAGSRALGVNYYNTTGKPILINVGVGATSAGTINCQATVNGVALALSQMSVPGAGYPIQTTVIIPPGASYSMLSGGVNSLSSWVELR